MIEWLILSILGTIGFTFIFVILTIIFSFAAVIGKDAYQQMKVEIEEEMEQKND